MLTIKLSGVNCFVDTPRSYQSSRPVNRANRAAASASASRTVVDQESFADFLRQHIDVALKKGFDDNVGRNHVAPIFHVRTNVVHVVQCSQ